MNKLTECSNHHSFSVFDNVVWESYKTYRGFRYREIVAVEYPNKERLSEQDISNINQILEKTVSDVAEIAPIETFKNDVHPIGCGLMLVPVVIALILIIGIIYFL